MGDRFFPNEMPDFVAETTVTVPGGTTNDSLTNLLSLPYKTFSDKLKTSALDLKQTIVRQTCGLSSGKRVQDYTLYTGALGTAYFVFRAYQVTKNEDDLKLCSDVVKACDSASKDSGRVTFICGRAGVCALGAVIAKHSGKGRCPLMYEWHGKKYWGAAHGLAGIMHVLMDMELKPDEVEDVKGTLRYMITNRFPSGNYPSNLVNESRNNQVT
ncbi:hypothetical protein PTKIN_Ptkin11bG0154300 [Pterospermum kingtungense]